MLLFYVVPVCGQSDASHSESYSLRAKEAGEKGDIREAIYWYRKKFQSTGPEDSEILQYAGVLHSAGLYDEAIRWYEKYRTLHPASQRAAKGIEACSDIRILERSKRKYRLYFFPGINSEESEWGIRNGDQALAFFSSRSSRPRQYRFQFSDQVRTPSNLPFCSGPVLDYDLLADSSLGVALIKDSLTGAVGMYFFTSDSGNWSAPQAMSALAEWPEVATPRFSPDGRFLFFAARNPDGKDGLDIWRLSADSLANGTPVLLKSRVNTDGDERIAGFSPVGDLYIASNGWPGLGGLDLFEIKLRHGKPLFSRPRHLGEPLNSPYDETEVLWSDAQNGYLTSNRPGGMGRSDIFKWQAEGQVYALQIMDTASSEAIRGAEIFKISTGGEEYFGYSDIEGKIAFLSPNDKTTHYRIKKEGYETLDLPALALKSDQWQIIPMRKEVDLRVIITLINRANGEKVEGLTVSAISGQDTLRLRSDKNGKVRLPIEPGTHWNFAVHEKGYLAAGEELESESWRKHGIYRINMPLNPLIKGRPIVLENILFKYKSTEIDREASKDLEKLLDMLIENPDLVVEVSTHTDSRGGFQYNEVLSQKRAQAVVDWLITRGVAPVRLVARGYGEYHLLNECADSVPCPEWKHRQNRRAEIKILGTRDSLDGLITAAGSDWDINPDDIPVYVPDSVNLARQKRELSAYEKEQNASTQDVPAGPTDERVKSKKNEAEYFMVQFAASTRPDDRFPAAEMLGPLAKEKFGKYTRFMLGPLTSLNDAYDLRARLRSAGFKDSFIVAYREGKRLKTQY